MKDREALGAGVSAIFTGSELSKNDKDLVVHVLQDAYWIEKGPK